MLQWAHLHISLTDTSKKEKQLIGWRNRIFSRSVDCGGWQIVACSVCKYWAIKLGPLWTNSSWSLSRGRRQPFHLQFSPVSGGDPTNGTCPKISRCARFLSLWIWSILWSDWSIWWQDGWVTFSCQSQASDKLIWRHAGKLRIMKFRLQAKALTNLPFLFFYYSLCPYLHVKSS